VKENFFAELKRRNVYEVAVAYAVVGWLLVQVATQVFLFFEIPNWTVRLIVLAIVIGFPIALVLAWAFELTPEGLKRAEDVNLATQPRSKSHGWIYVVVIGAAISVSLFFLVVTPWGILQVRLAPNCRRNRSRCFRLTTCAKTKARLILPTGFRIKS